MFGFLTAAGEVLSETESIRYKACYCGLCRCLKENYGNLHRLTLNYDATFLVLLLDSLEEPEIICGENCCPRHMFEKQSWQQSSYTEYAADITVALSCLKAKDNWEDDSSLIARSAYDWLKKPYHSVSEKYPELFNVIESEMVKLSDAERTGESLPDECADCFGIVLGSIFSQYGGRWKSVLYRFGYSLGKFIYLMDAAVDWEDDLKRGRFNPFSKLQQENPREYFREILEMYLGDCVRAYDILPLVKDTGILKNILCVGVWSQFNKKYPIKELPDHVSGSV